MMLGMAFLRRTFMYCLEGPITSRQRPTEELKTANTDNIIIICIRFTMSGVTHANAGTLETQMCVNNKTVHYSDLYTFVKHQLKAHIILFVPSIGTGNCCSAITQKLFRVKKIRKQIDYMIKGLLATTYFFILI